VWSDLLRYFAGLPLPDLGRDLLDIFITYYIFYRVALVLKGTRAMQVGIGLVGIFVLYVVAQLLQLHTVLTLLGAVLSSAILIGVVVFQNDIRRGLMRVGAGARFGSGQNLESEVIDAVVEAATQLARHRMGALITFEQEANLDEFVGSHTGCTLDASVTPELLVSLFIPEGLNKLHDGAVVIRDLRVAKAGVFFPLPEGRVSDASFGSRHRAAMGITEETDAVVIVVSEERGSISFCFNGNIVPNLDGPRLRAALDAVFAPKRKERRTSRLGRWFGGRPKSEERAEAPPSSSLADSAAPSTVIERSAEVTRVEEPRQEPVPAAKPAPLRRSSVSEAEDVTAKRAPESENIEDDARPTVTAVKPVRVDGPQPAPLRKNPETKKHAEPGEAPRPDEPNVDVAAPVTRRTGVGETPEPARPMPRADEPPRGAEGGVSEGDRTSTEGITP
jgi:uncharacterized protein (TIGR00159 family)